MAKTLILKRKINPERAKDVAHMRALLATNGYTADDGMIEAAYASWSSSLPHSPAWHPLSYMVGNPAKLLEALLTQLEPVEEQLPSIEVIGTIPSVASTNPPQVSLKGNQ